MGRRARVATLLAGALLALEAPDLAQEGRAIDLTAWRHWWERSKGPYLNLKLRLRHAGDSGGWFCFISGKPSADSLFPTAEQIDRAVVPALLAALERETNADVVTGCLIALAKIGEAPVETGPSKLASVFEPYLFDPNPEVSETAALALGILARDSAVPTLAALVEDTREGRELVEGAVVPYRTRAFAAYGLSLIGAATAREAKRREIVRVLTDVIEAGDTQTIDLAVACVIALGLVPLETIEPPQPKEDRVPRRVESRIDQLRYLLGYLQDEDNPVLVRAHCPTALARLLERLPEEESEIWRARIGEDLRARASDWRGEPAEVVQSAVLALGSIGTSAEEDRAIRDVLEAGPRFRTPQARGFSMIAMARAGGALGCGGDIEPGVDQSVDFVLEHLEQGEASIRPWAALGVGLLASELEMRAVGSGTIRVLSDALRSALRDERHPTRLGAYSIAAGILGDVESTEILLEKLQRTADDEARGHVAVALGLIGSREAIAPIRAILLESEYRPELLRQAAIALRLLGNEEVVADLVDMLAAARGYGTQPAIASALGLVGDRRSIEPLVQLLEDPNVTPLVRACAAEALGFVADKEPLPWNTKIAFGLNYRASTETLSDPRTGGGVLDLR